MASLQEADADGNPGPAQWPSPRPRHSASKSHTANTGRVDMIGALPALIAPLRFGIVAQQQDAHFQHHKQRQGVPLANGQTKMSLYKSQAVYRGSCPRSRHLPFLGRLRLKTILSLTPKPLEKLDGSLVKWAQEHDIRVVHVHCDKPKGDGGGLSKEAAAKALLNVLDARNLPIYIHCLDGQSVSTLMVAVIRKVQAWAPAAIADEMTRAVGHDEEILQYQLSFVDSFGKLDGVRLPPRRHIPDWTWSDPSPLRRLRDPYDVLPSREKPAAGLVLNASGNPESSLMGTQYSHSHVRQMSSDDGGPSSAAPSPPLYGVGALPIQHPTLKLRFDADPELPPPPHFAFNQFGRENSALLSPGPSRPSSRMGRPSSHSAPSNQQNTSYTDARAQAQANAAFTGSPRRRLRNAETLGAIDGRRALDISDHAMAGRASPSGEILRSSVPGNDSSCSSPRFEHSVSLVDLADPTSPSRYSARSQSSTTSEEPQTSTPVRPTKHGKQSSDSSSTLRSISRAPLQCDVASAHTLETAADVSDAKEPHSPSTPLAKACLLSDTPTPRATTSLARPTDGRSDDQDNEEVIPLASLAQANKTRNTSNEDSASSTGVATKHYQSNASNGGISSLPSTQQQPPRAGATDGPDLSEGSSAETGHPWLGNAIDPKHADDSHKYAMGEPYVGDAESASDLGGGDDGDHSPQQDEVETEEEMEEEDEEAIEEEEEEEDEEEGDDVSENGSDLALEALDLEGY